jgi:hypothetical protein
VDVAREVGGCEEAADVLVRVERWFDLRDLMRRHGVAARAGREHRVSGSRDVSGSRGVSGLRG